MTEAEWQGSIDPRPMLDTLRGTKSDRKWRLFACACCRRLFSQVLIDDRTRNAIAVSELYADGLITEQERRKVEQSVLDARKLAVEAAAKTAYVPGADRTPEEELLDAVEWVLWAIGIPEAEVWIAEKPDQRKSQCDLLRELFNNPFHHISVDPTWLTSSVVSIATAIYADRSFHRMQELGDALQQVGYTHDGILQHCRENGEHIRGCWVLDLLLDKK